MNHELKYFTSLNPRGEHRIAYSDYGRKTAPIIIGVHGLTGNGYDFDYLAPELVIEGYRFIAVDLAGRGRSDFLPDPTDYNYKQYLYDLRGLIHHLGAEEVDWIGISLGGLLGIKLAGMEDSPIKRLVINDVGPEVPRPALEFIHQVISQQYEFDDMEALEKRMRETRGLTWGPITDEQWAHMARHNVRELVNGKISYAYDPAIARVFETAPLGDDDLWPHWQKIKCPVQLLWGQKSVVLTEQIIKNMEKKGPLFDLCTFSDCGHVPSLMAPGQIQVITNWLGSF